MSVATDIERVKYTFVRPSNPFSEPLYIHDDYLRQFVNKKKTTPDPKIAGLRLSYQQLRKFTSDPSIERPGIQTMWDGRTVCDFCLGIVFQDIKQKLTKEKEKRLLPEPVSASAPPVKRQRVTEAKN